LRLIIKLENFQKSRCMTITDNVTPVVVLASPHHGGLGITRSLGRLGVPVFNVDSSRWAPALFSRYCKGRFIWDLDNAPPAKSVEYLVDLARRVGQRPILIPGTDSAAIFVAEHAADLEPWYIFPAQSRALVHSLCSKREMYRLARRLHIPTPLTLCPQAGSDWFQWQKRLDLPVMVKGSDCQLFRRGSKTKLIVRTRQQFLELYDSLRNTAAPDLIIQEYIRGGEDTVWMFNGYFNERSECLVSFTGKKLRQCPAYTGVTSLGSSQRNEVIAETAKKLMKAVGYQGIVDMDFCYDARDGRYKLLDVNPRIGSTFRLFVSDEGMDVARACYLDLTSQNVPSAPVRDGRKWIVEDFDLVASWRYYRDGKLTFRDWLSSLRGIHESAFFAADDPLPALLMMRADFSELFQRVIPRRHPAQGLNREPSAAPAISTASEKNACF
jgi:D-aspartate ligase